MIGILAIRTAASALSIVYGGFGKIQILNLILGILLGVLFFFFVAYWLHVIGSMRGYRTVFGTRWSRWHFDAYLAICLLIHIGLVGGVFVGLPGYAQSVCWFVMGLTIWGVAWVAGWPDEEAGAAYVV